VDKELTIRVKDKGDPSVGIEVTYWDISGPIDIEDIEQREGLRKALQKAFTWITENPVVLFSDEPF